MNNLSNILFVIAGILWGIELIPQLIKTIKTKKVEDISIFFPSICFSAYLVFFIGSLLILNWALIFSHLLPFFSTGTLLFLVIKYRNKK